MNDIDLGPDLRAVRKALLLDETGDYAVLKHVLSEIIKEGQSGWGLEFGVATGSTLAIIASLIPVIGFDSFKGLPEDWRPGYVEGAFSDVRPSGPIPNSTIVEGWFHDTVPNYPWPSQIALVHIDCDLYSSAKIVLESLVGHLNPGTYIVFDEFFGYEGSEEHEEKAFREWAYVHEVEYEVIGHGREQWAVRIA